MSHDQFSRISRPARDRHRSGSRLLGSGTRLAPDPANPAFLAPRDGNGSCLHLDEDDRTHLDIWAPVGADLDTEVARLTELGARRVEWNYPDDAEFVVLEDTEGNVFCLVAAPQVGPDD